MTSWIWDFLSTEGFQPHGICLLWRPDVFWTHLISDGIIALSYFSIPLAIIYFALRRPDIRYGWVLYLFGGFIVACGITHVFGIWTMWVPDYGMQAVIKAGTAAISATTAFALWPLMPRLLAVPSPLQLEEQNARLAEEIAVRKAAEANLAALNEQLEQRVIERTASLARANENLRQARASAERSARGKAEFLAAMSHEIRTPMNGVLGMLELLKLEDLPPEHARYIGIARESAEGLLEVINDILDYSRLDSGSVELESLPFSPVHVVDQVVSLLSEGASEKGVTLETDIDEGVPETLVGDPTRLRQILFNLVGNAIKFTDNGDVRVSVACAATQTSRELRVEVRDTGIGISPESLARLFDRFSQAEPSTMRRFGGSGLGLAIAKQLVELMGGEIGVESEPGHGSRFWFTIRCAPAPGATVREVQQTGASSVRPLRVLVAEDNGVNQLLVTRLLERGGHAVEIAATGTEAVAMIERQSFDLVLMDLTMPDMDGLEATRRIRALSGPPQSLPVVALTANAMAADRERCMAAGMTDYVPKPIVPAALFAAIARALEATEAARLHPNSAERREALG